jgi:putative transcriptional regulator
VRKLLAILGLFFIGLPVCAEESGVRALLLVARKDMPDPFFRNSVVLVTNATIAPLGVIINKPTDVKLSKALPDEKALASREDKLFFGGPVAADELVFVFRAAKRPEEALPIKDDLYFSTSKALLEKMLAREDPLDGLRVFAGHAGWGPGQLEGEIQRGDWYLAPADAGIVFSAKPEGLWPELYSRTAATKVRYVP